MMACILRNMTIIPLISSDKASNNNDDNNNRVINEDKFREIVIQEECSRGLMRSIT
ncbi:MAG TPA: hypothetical protein VI278_13845 [Nitrososphaeraceae archaeon]